MLGGRELKARGLRKREREREAISSGQLEGKGRYVGFGDAGI